MSDVDRDQSTYMRGPFKDARWRCPSCHNWKKEPISKNCLECRRARGEVIRVARELEGEQYYTDLFTIDEPDQQVERMLDMLFAIEKCLDDREGEAVDEDAPEETYQRIVGANQTIGELYDKIKRLKSEG